MMKPRKFNRTKGRIEWAGYSQARDAGALVFQKENLGVPEAERVREFPESIHG